MLTSVFWSNDSISSIVPIHQDTEVHWAANAGTNYLSIAAPNESGISVNHFSRFYAVRPIKIINSHRTISTIDGEKEVLPARLIVIYSNYIHLRNSIEILGASSDILFITSSPNGVISCQPCSIQNALRISLVTGSASLLSNNAGEGDYYQSSGSYDYQFSEIGEITSGNSSRIIISSLNAPGLISLDILAKHISITGSIDINQKASQTYTGAYVSDPNGDLDIGTGSVNLLLGPLRWDYDENVIKSIMSWQENTIGGEIYSSGIKITSAGRLTVHTWLNTKTAALSSLSYDQGTYVPVEGIDIQTFGFGDLNVYGQLQTSGEANLKSTGLVLLLNEAIDAQAVTIIAGKEIDNRKDITGRTISMEGMHVFNEGMLEAEEAVSLRSEQHLANHFGGVIKSKTVRLQSKEQVVINGSRYPYRSRMHGVEFEEGRYLGRSVGYRDMLIDPDRYMDKLNPSYLGTFYTMKSRPLTHFMGLKSRTRHSYVRKPTNAPDLSAHIVAERLYVKSVGFENINPYYVEVDEEGVIGYDMDLLGQVSISVEKYAAIDASDYVVNSSAEFEVNASDGVLAAKTGIFINERYRTVSPVDQKPPPCGPVHQYHLASGLIACPSHFYGKDDPDLVLESETLSNSPPGRITAMGDLQIDASERIVSNTAYTEVYGNADFYSPNLDIFGFENERIYLNHDIDKVVTDSGPCFKTSRGWMLLETRPYTRPVRCPSEYIKHETYVDSSVISAIRTIEGDSLFLIHGILNANASDTWFENHNPMNGLFEKLIEQRVSESHAAHYTEYYESSGSVDWASDVDEVKETAQIKILDTVYWLYEEILKVLADLSSAVTKFLNELGWWEKEENERQENQ